MSHRSFRSCDHTFQLYMSSIDQELDYSQIHKIDDSLDNRSVDHAEDTFD